MFFTNEDVNSSQIQNVEGCPIIFEFIETCSDALYNSPGAHYNNLHRHLVYEHLAVPQCIRIRKQVDIANALYLD